MLKVGECIRSFRLEAGLLQREMADRAGISASMLSLIEAGKRTPTIALLQSVSRALNLPPTVLLAAALLDDENAPQTREMQDARRLAQHLLNAARHMLIAERLRNERERNAQAVNESGPVDIAGSG